MLKRSSRRRYSIALAVVMVLVLPSPASAAPVGAGMGTGVVQWGSERDGCDVSGPGLTQDAGGKVMALQGQGNLVKDIFSSLYYEFCADLTAGASGLGPNCITFGGLGEGRIIVGDGSRYEVSDLRWGETGGTATTLSPFGLRDDSAFIASGTYAHFAPGDESANEFGAIEVSVNLYHWGSTQRCNKPDGLRYAEHRVTISLHPNA